MVPLSFVMLTVRIVDFILRLDFTDILKVAAQQEKKNRLGLVNMLLLLYYLVIFLVSTFDTYFPELHLESRFRLPLVMGYLYLLLFVLGAVNQFAKEKIEQDLAMKQANYLDDLKRENTRVEGLYRDLMHVRSNYNFLLNNLRDIERTGIFVLIKKIWLIFMSIEISIVFQLRSQIWIISKIQVFIVYFHQNTRAFQIVASIFMQRFQIQ